VTNNQVKESDKIKKLKAKASILKYLVQAGHLLSMNCKMANSRTIAGELIALLVRLLNSPNLLICMDHQTLFRVIDTLGFLLKGSFDNCRRFVELDGIESIVTILSIGLSEFMNLALVNISVTEPERQMRMH